MKMLFLSASLMLSASSVSAELIFVSNERDNTVTVLDGASMEVVKTLETSARPRGIITSHDGSLVYVCAGDDNRLDVVDVATLEIVAHLDSGPDPELLDVDHAGKRIYIANEDDAMVTVMERDGTIVTEIGVGIEPEGMAVAPDDSVVVTTSESTGMAHFIDTATLELVGNTIVDTRPRHAEFEFDGSHVWVTSEIGGTVSVLSAENYGVEHVINFEIQGIKAELIQPVGLRFSGDGALAFVALGPSNHVAVVDSATYEVTDYVLVGQRPWHIERSLDDKSIYVANGLSNDMTIIDIASLKATRSIPVGRLPWGIAVAPNL